MRAFWAIICTVAAITIYTILESGPAEVRVAEQEQPERPTNPSAQNASTAVTLAPATAGGQHNDPIATSTLPLPANSNQTAPDAATALAREFDAAYGARPDAEKSIPAPPSAQPTVAPPGDNVGNAITKISPGKDGAMLIDDRFVLRGSGTEADPYEPSWDVLASASDTYVPRLQMLDIPGRISMLDGKHIRIHGFLFVPLYHRGDVSEVLVMRNVWDGCCIGVPPTAYDAIEVKLKVPISMNEWQFVQTCMLTGTLKIAPFVNRDWLVGLYVMENGRIESDAM